MPFYLLDDISVVKDVDGFTFIAKRGDKQIELHTDCAEFADEVAQLKSVAILPDDHAYIDNRMGVHRLSTNTNPGLLPGDDWVVMRPVTAARNDEFIVLRVEEYRKFVRDCGNQWRAYMDALKDLNNQVKQLKRNKIKREIQDVCNTVGAGDASVDSDQCNSGGCV